MMIIKKTKLNALIFFWYILSLLPIIVFFNTFSKYAINIPFLDDFTFFNFIPSLYNEKETWSKVDLFFDQHNEHRILVDRLIALLVYFVNSTLDYKLLMLIGNSFLIGILIVYFKVFKQIKVSFKYFVPLTFLIFHTQLFENSFWGMAAVQNFGVVLFVSILLYLISTNNKRSYFYWSFFIAFLATYTSGNGIISTLVASILLLLQNRIKDFFIFSAFVGILLLSYLYGYIPPSSINYFNGVGFKDICIGYFSFLGSISDIFRGFSSRYIFTIVVGSVAFIFIGVISIKSIFKSKLFFTDKSLSSLELFLLGGILFILGTAATVVISRVNFGQESLLVSRYRIYSILLFINLYFMLLYYLRDDVRKLIIYPILILSIGYNFISNYQSYYDVVSLKKTRICGLANDIMANKKNPIQRGILVYQKPHLWFDEFLQAFKKPIVKSPIWDKKYSINQYSDFLVVVENNTETYLKKNEEDGVYLLLQSADNTFILPTNQRKNSIKSFLQTGQLWANGFIGDFSTRELDAGNYKIGVWIQKENKGESFYLNDSLSVK